MRGLTGAVPVEVVASASGSHICSIPTSPSTARGSILLADDPGAGKTIMAGLLIKKLIIRGDLEHCLIIAPGNLVEQWQDELKDKFDLTFDIVSREQIETSVTGNPFVERSRLIMRLDMADAGQGRSREQRGAARGGRASSALIYTQEKNRRRSRVAAHRHDFMRGAIALGHDAAARLAQPVRHAGVRQPRRRHLLAEPIVEALLAERLTPFVGEERQRFGRARAGFDGGQQCFRNRRLDLHRFARLVPDWMARAELRDLFVGPGGMTFGLLGLDLHACGRMTFGVTGRTKLNGINDRCNLFCG